MSHRVFSKTGRHACARWRGETIRIEAIGRNAVRIRATMNADFQHEPISALLPDDGGPEAQIVVGEDCATVQNGLAFGELRLVERGMGPALEVRITNTQSGDILVQEEIPHILWPGARAWKAEGGNLWSLRQRFKAYDDEKIFGMGQHQHGRFDQKGCVIDLLQMNTEVVIPFFVSSRGYGVIWNSPGTGHVEFAENRTLWCMDAVPEIDYVVIVGDTPGNILEVYGELTGKPPMIPEWAMGFWQCKLRYETQDEVLQVARQYKERGLPISCLVIDFFHWTKMGEWKFRAEEFPDPSSMVTELKSMDIKPMVSVWPTVNANAETFGPMKDAGYIIGSSRGAFDGSIFYDREPDGMNALHFYDATNPDAREFHWDRVKAGYVNHGIDSFWLDANEPEMYPMHPENLRYRAGDGRSVTNAYPFLHQTGYADHMTKNGLDDGIMLSRSAWLGTQRFPCVVWSGDVKSTFADFKKQITAGLNMAMSGISWWTTDIGGFKGGDINDDDFRELMIRWFQYGCFCPVMRLHGFRQDRERDPRFGHEFSFGGADNEIWSFGEEAYSTLRAFLELRERLRPYLRDIMRKASEHGTPPMRPLFVDFPDDQTAWMVSDAYMFGDSMLVAPVTDIGARTRTLYLPGKTVWMNAWTGEEKEGGKHVTVDAPLNQIPVMLRKGFEGSNLFRPSEQGGRSVSTLD